MKQKKMRRFDTLRDLNQTTARNFQPHTEETFEAFEAAGVRTLNQFSKRWNAVSKKKTPTAEMQRLAKHAQQVLTTRASVAKREAQLRAKRNAKRAAQTPTPLPQPKPTPLPTNPPTKSLETLVEAGGRLVQAVPRIRIPLSLLAEQYPEMEIEISLS